MYGKVYTAAITGIDGFLVAVEADVGDGLPSFDMVGYLGAEVREARERVRTALKNSGFYLPPCRITVNLSPADMRKQGNYFDLPIALAILIAAGLLEQHKAEGRMFTGELGLDGALRPVDGTLALADCGRKAGIRHIFVPRDNAREAACLEELCIYGVDSLSGLIRILGDEDRLAGCREPAGVRAAENRKLRADYRDICGQRLMKRATVIAAAGMHNLLYIGPPGSGKSMCAKRIPTILQPMTAQEQIEVTKIYSICGLLEAGAGLIEQRPFRSPHHTISPYALAGGGSVPKPGEISLAHNGVLFLDELAEFKRETLEIMRQPLEDAKVTISRLQGTYVYPARFMLAAAMNGCPCGYFPDRKHCRCSAGEIRRYQERISQPLLDRIDLCVQVQAVGFKELMEGPAEEDSAAMCAKVSLAAARQKKRYRDENILYNSQLTGGQLHRYCRLDRRKEQLLQSIFERLSLSARARDRILRVSRTIADIEGKEDIEEAHLAEAVGYRVIDKKSWGIV